MYMKAAIITTIAQHVASKRLKKLQKNSDLETCTGYTGAEISKMILERRKIEDVTVVHHKKSNAYDAEKNRIHLASDVYFETSVADSAIAAHEASHAVQDKVLDQLKWIRLPIRLVSLFTSIIGMLILPLLLFFDIGDTVLFVWKLHFASACLFLAIAIFIELDANVRAYRELVILQVITTGKEKREVLNVLSTAFLTYLFAFLTNVLFFLALCN